MAKDYHLLIPVHYLSWFSNCTTVIGISMAIDCWSFAYILTLVRYRLNTDRKSSLNQCKRHKQTHTIIKIALYHGLLYKAVFLMKKLWRSYEYNRSTKITVCPTVHLDTILDVSKVYFIYRPSTGLTSISGPQYWFCQLFYIHHGV